MRALLLLSLAAALLLAPAEARDAKDEMVEKELKKLEGSWILVWGQVDGQEMAKEELRKAKLTRGGKAAAVEVPHLSKEPIKNETVRVDPTKNPKEIDLLRVAGPNTGKIILGIYEVGDDGSYKLCFDPSGKERPKEFKSEPGSGYVFHVWKRATK